MPHNVKFKRTFCAAHRLSDYEGACHNIHGHNYRVEITIASPNTVPPGFIIDFSEVKKVIDALDHTLILYEDDPLVDILNGAGELFTIVGFEPTTESLADYIADGIYDMVTTLGQKPWWVGVVLQETDHIQAEAYAGDGPWEESEESLTFTHPSST